MFTLVAKTGESFPVDSMLLLEKSAYCKALHLSGMKELESKTLKLDLLSKDSLDEVYHFFLESSNDTDSSASARSCNVDAGLDAALYLQIDEMVDKYLLLLISTLQSSNCFHALDICLKYSLDRRPVLDFICSNLTLCHTEEGFLHLDSDFLEYIIKSDSTCAESEAEILDAILRWILHESSRVPFIKLFMPEIRFGLMDTNELKKCKTSLKSLSIEATYIDKLIEESKAGRPRLRCAVEVVVALGGIDVSDSHKEVVASKEFQIIPTSDIKRALQTINREISVTQSSVVPSVSFKTGKRPKLRLGVYKHSICVLDGLLYLAGGYDGDTSFRSVYAYDPVAAKWSKCAGMKAYRYWFYFGELGGYLYVVGGTSHYSYDHCPAERYLPSSNVWEAVAPLPILIFGCVGCSDGRYLYVSGGSVDDDTRYVNHVWKYDPSLNRWDSLTPMLIARGHHAMVAANDKLYVAGGLGHSESKKCEAVMDVEMYDPESEQWCLISRLDRSSSFMSSIVTDGHFCLIGGQCDVDGIDYMQVISLDEYEDGSNVTSKDLDTSVIKKAKRVRPLNRCQTLKFTANETRFFDSCLMKFPKRLVKNFNKSLN